jgi:chromosomal replication initiation ATPase DnaA
MKADRARMGVAVAVVAASVGAPVEDIVGGKRRTEVAFARQAAMYLTYVAYGMSLGRVAAAFGRDRSTVAHACRVMEERRDEPRFDRWMDSLEASVARVPVAA